MKILIFFLSITISITTLIDSFNSNSPSFQLSSSGSSSSSEESDYDDDERNTFHRRYMEQNNYKEIHKLPVDQYINNNSSIINNEIDPDTKQSQIAHPSRNTQFPTQTIQTQSKDLRRIIQELEESDYGN